MTRWPDRFNSGAHQRNHIKDKSVAVDGACVGYLARHPLFPGPFIDPAAVLKDRAPFAAAAAEGVREFMTLGRCCEGRLVASPSALVSGPADTRRQCPMLPRCGRIARLCARGGVLFGFRASCLRPRNRTVRFQPASTFTPALPCWVRIGNRSPTLMNKKSLWLAVLTMCTAGLLTSPLSAEIGQRFPSEKKVVVDPVTGVPLTFLTTTANGDSKIYQTHQQWTADGQWLIFRSRRAGGQAMAVNEATGDMVQVTEKGYMGMLCNAHHAMKLYIMRDASAGAGRGPGPDAAPGVAPEGAPVGAARGGPTGAPGARGGFNRPRGPFQIVEVDLAKLFADSAAGTLKPADQYEHVCGTMPADMTADGNMGIDANDDFAYFRIGGEYVVKHLAPGTKIEQRFGPRGMGAGPTGLGSMNLKTGEVKFVVGVGFQIGHVQTNPWVPGEIIFCWETGGKAPQRTWIVNADGTGLRALYPEAAYDWITHEAVITKDEVAIAMLAHRRPGLPATADWGPESSTGEHPSGVGIVNLRTREMRIVGQVPIGNPGRSIWHVNGSPDGRWAVADDFQYRLWLIDRHSGEMTMLADLGHRTTAQDHIHPTFSLDSTRIEVQTAMLADDKRTLNICVVPVPKTWLARTYSDKLPE